jgi:hypothetical protein
MGLLDSSRVPLPLIPERLIAEAAQAQALDRKGIEGASTGDGTAQVALDPGFLPVLDDALGRWRGMVRTIWVRLPFTMQRQEQRNWCWAAVAVSVARHYAVWSTWKQCEVVNLELGQTTCCTDGSTRECDRGHGFAEALARTEVLDRVVGGVVDEGTIREEIDHGRPLGIDIQWGGCRGHFIVIDGYADLLFGGDLQLSISDPFYGSYDVAFSELAGGAFLGSGAWAHTLFTKPPPWPFRVPETTVLFPRSIWESVLEAHDELMLGSTG